MSDLVLVLWSGVLSVAGFLFGTLFKGLSGRVTKVEQDVADHREEVAQRYTTKDDVRDLRDQIIRELQAQEERQAKRLDQIEKRIVNGGARG